MGAHNTTFDMGQLTDNDQLADPGEGGTLDLRGRGYGVLNLPSTSATNQVILPTAPAGTMVLVINNTGAGITCNDGTSDSLTVDDGETGIALSRGLVSGTSLWTGDVQTSTGGA